MKKILLLVMLIITIPAFAAKKPYCYGIYVNSAGSPENVRQLFVAACQGNLTNLEEIIKSGVKPNAKSKQGESAILFAALKGQLNIVKYLYHYDPKAKDKFDTNTLMYAAIGGQLNVAEYLYEQDPKVDLNKQDTYGNTALMYSAMGLAGNTVLPFLLERGANPNIKNENGMKAIDFAINGDNVDDIKLLLKYHTKLDYIAKDDDYGQGLNPLQRACDRKDLKSCFIIKQALKKEKQ